MSLQLDKIKNEDNEPQDGKVAWRWTCSDFLFSFNSFPLPRTLPSEGCGE